MQRELFKELRVERVGMGSRLGEFRPDQLPLSLELFLDIGAQSTDS